MNLSLQDFVISELFTPIPSDDPSRKLKIAKPDTDQSLPQIGLVRDTYTILITR